jgi:hypothetical protein
MIGQRVLSLVLAAVRKTDALIEKARRLAAGTEYGGAAFPGLRRAFELLEDAKQALASRSFKRAEELTTQARRAIAREIRAALDTEDIEQAVARARQYWRRTNAMIERLADAIDFDKHPGAREALKNARDLQEKAAQSLERKNPAAALRFANKARETVRELARLAVHAVQIHERLGNAEEKIETVRENVAQSDNTKAEKVLRAASVRFEKAEKLAREGNDLAAAKELDVAMKLTARASNLASGAGPGAKLLEREIKRTAAVVTRAETVAHTGQQKADAASARELLDRAIRTKDNPQKALELLDEATDHAFTVIAEGLGNRGESPEGPLQSGQRPG